MSGSVLGAFEAPGPAAAAIRALRAGGFTVQVAMPAPHVEVLAALGRPVSRLALVTLPMALAGFLAGVALVVGTTLSWPHATGGQPLVAFPPLVIVGFEVAVLAGALANLAGLVVCLRRGGGAGAFPAGERFDGHRIGIAASGGDGAEAERLLRAAGAEEVRRAG